MLTPAAVIIAHRLTGGAAALSPALTKMSAAARCLGMPIAFSTTATSAPVTSTVTLPAPVSAPGTSNSTVSSTSSSARLRWKRRRIDRTTNATPPDSFRRFMKSVAVTKMRLMSR